MTVSKLVAALFAVAFLLLASPAHAQAASDLVYVGGQLTGRAALDDRPGKIEDRSFRAAIAPPAIALGDRDFLRLGLMYRYTALDLDSIAALPGETTRRDLHAIDLSLAWSHVLGRRWVATAVVIPGIRSDFEQTFSTRDVQLAGVAIATYFIGGDPHFRLSLGLFAATNWSFSPVIPFAGIAYENPTFAVDAGFNGANAVVRLGNRVELGVFLGFASDWYHVEAGPAPPLASARYLRVLDVVAGPQVNVRAVGPVWLNARAGYTVVHDRTYGDENRDKVGGTSLDAGGTFSLQLGVSVRDARR